MLTCKNFTEEAHELLEGNPSFFKRLRMRFHLLICKNCRIYTNQLWLTLQTLRNKSFMPEEAPTDAEIDAIIARLKDVE